MTFAKVSLLVFCLASCTSERSSDVLIKVDKGVEGFFIVYLDPTSKNGRQNAEGKFLINVSSHRVGVGSLDGMQQWHRLTCELSPGEVVQVDGHEDVGAPGKLVLYELSAYATGEYLFLLGTPEEKNYYFTLVRPESIETMNEQIKKAKSGGAQPGQE